MFENTYQVVCFQDKISEIRYLSIIIKTNKVNNKNPRKIE